MKLKLGLATTPGYQVAAFAGTTSVGAISSPASGTFEANLDGDTLSYTLTYSGLSTEASSSSSAADHRRRATSRPVRPGQRLRRL